MDLLLELLRNPNFGAAVFGGVGVIITAFFGWLAKRPLMRQAAFNELFKAQIAGYETLVRSQAARIAYLESQESIHDATELELIRRLRECEARHQRRDQEGG